MSMRTIIHENYYQRKIWDEAILQREFKAELTSTLLDNEIAFEKRRQESYEQLRKKLEANELSVVEFCSPIGRLKFRLAKSYALKVARHFEMDVIVKVSDTLGIIELFGNDLMCDSLWNDGKHKRQFLLLFLFASGVCVTDKPERNGGCIHIWLSYQMIRKVDGKRKKM